MADERGDPVTSTMKIRIAIGAVGVAGIVYGGVRILANSRQTNPHGLAEWLIATAIIHDGIIAPLTCLLGVILSRLVRPRARRYLQAALIIGAFLTVIALPEIHRRGTQPAAKGWLLQDYHHNLIVLLGVVAGLALVSYLIATARARRQTKQRPPA